MGAISVVLLVAFVIICVLSILLVLVQEPDNSGMGGMLGGGNSQAFGSHSASVLTKTTVVFVILFFILTFLLALLNKGAKLNNDLSDVAAESGLVSDSKSDAAAADWWKKVEEAPAAPIVEPVETAPAVEAEPESVKSNLIMNSEQKATVSQ